MVQGIVTPQKSHTPEEERDLYQTPPDLFSMLNKLYGPFKIDGAANESNHLLPLWLGPGGIREDALSLPWGEEGEEVKIFINPPWSRGNLYRFLAYASKQHRDGRALATFLLPATTDVAWFHDFVWDAAKAAFYPWIRVEFISPRVKYIRPNGKIAHNPGIGSMVVSFRSWEEDWADKPDYRGRTLRQYMRERKLRNE